MPPRPPGPVPITKEGFDTLVADLRTELAPLRDIERKAITSGTRTPVSFEGRPWVHAAIILKDAAALAGYSRNTLAEYARPSGRAYMTYAKFPRHVPGGPPFKRRWRIGDIAIWKASRNPESGRPKFTDAEADALAARMAAGELPSVLAAEYGVNPRSMRKIRNREAAGFRETGRTGRTAFGGRPDLGAAPFTGITAPVRSPARRPETLAFLTALVASRPAVTWGEAKTVMRAGGMRPHQRRDVMDDARAAALPAILRGFASARPDGQVGIPEAAAAFGVTYYRFRSAISRGEILAVKDGPRWVTDPERLRFRRDRTGYAWSPVPVDKTHPLAVPIPGDRAEGDEAA